jgi:hypothetical protein
MCLGKESTIFSKNTTLFFKNSTILMPPTSYLSNRIASKWFNSSGFCEKSFFEIEFGDVFIEFLIYFFWNSTFYTIYIFKGGQNRFKPKNIFAGYRPKFLCYNAL